MKISLFILVSLVFQSTLAQSPAEKQLLDLHSRKFRWMTNKQLDSLSLLLDDRLQYIHSNGWTETRQEVLDDLTSGKLNYTNVTVEEASVRLYDDSAVITGKGVFEVLLDGKPISIHLSYTEVYVRQKKQWRLVSRHACKI